jgi:hypothetical protein
LPSVAAFFSPIANDVLVARCSDGSPMSEPDVVAGAAAAMTVVVVALPADRVAMFARKEVSSARRASCSTMTALRSRRCSVVVVVGGGGGGGALVDAAAGNDERCDAAVVGGVGRRLAVVLAGFDCAAVADRAF